MTDGKIGQRGSALVLLSGLPGAGKTTFARALLEAIDGVHIESDAIRRELFATPVYELSEHARVFGTAARRVQAALGADRTVVFDATNLTTRDRRRFVVAAEKSAATLVAVRLVAPEEVLRERLSGPREGWSQADLRVLELMRRKPQPFTVPVVVVDTRFPTGPAVELVVALLGQDDE